jgi:hypothetical protein
MNCCSLNSLKHYKLREDNGDVRLNLYSNEAFVNGTIHLYSDDEPHREQQLQWMIKQWIYFSALIERCFLQKLKIIVLNCILGSKSFLLLLEKIHPVIFQKVLLFIWPFTRQRLGKHVPKRYKSRRPLLQNRFRYHGIRSVSDTTQMWTAEWNPWSRWLLHGSLKVIKKEVDSWIQVSDIVHCTL